MDVVIESAAVLTMPHGRAVVEGRRGILLQHNLWIGKVDNGAPMGVDRTLGRVAH